MHDSRRAQAQLLIERYAIPVRIGGWVAIDEEARIGHLQAADVLEVNAAGHAKETVHSDIRSVVTIGSESEMDDEHAACLYYKTSSHM